MIRFNRMMALVLALLLALGLCACGASEAPAATEAPETTPATEAPAAAPETEAADDGKVTYTIHVQDENGAPLSGVMVQICKDACLPGMTDAEGNAVFTVAEDDYKASFLSLPASYDYTTEETEFYFDGATEITLVLKAAA